MLSVDNDVHDNKDILWKKVAYFHNRLWNLRFIKPVINCIDKLPISLDHTYFLLKTYLLPLILLFGFIYFLCTVKGINLSTLSILKKNIPTPLCLNQRSKFTWRYGCIVIYALDCTYSNVSTRTVLYNFLCKQYAWYDAWYAVELTLNIRVYFDKTSLTYVNLITVTEFVVNNFYF